MTSNRVNCNSLATSGVYVASITDLQGCGRQLRGW